MAASSSKDYVVRVATADGSSKTITGATAANPVVVTSNSHGLANGSVVYISGIVGMEELNERAFVIANQTTNTFELKGVDGTDYTAYASGGTALPKTMTEIARVQSTNLFGGETARIDITDQRSRRKRYLVDIPDSGDGSLSLFFDNSDAGQARLRVLKGTTEKEAFTATMPSGAAAAFMAQVLSFPVSTGVGAAITTQVGLLIDNEEAWYA
jgi:hypothetical protein